MPPLGNLHEFGLFQAGRIGYRVKKTSISDQLVLGSTGLLLLVDLALSSN